MLDRRDSFNPTPAVFIALLILFALWQSDRFVTAAAFFGPNRAVQRNAPSQTPAVPQTARDALDRGMAAARQGQVEEARAQFQKAIDLFPAYAEAWFQLGLLQAQRNELEAARGSCEAAIQADPKLAGAYLLLTGIYEAKQDWPGVVRATEEVIRNNPSDYPQAYLYNALGYYHADNLALAEQRVREAQKYDPKYRFPRSWQLLGTILAARGDYAGAAGQLRKYLELVPSDPNNAEVRRNLADMEERARKAQPAAAFDAEANLVLISFQVSPAKGRFVTDLRPDDIEIREDGVPQKVAVFEGGIPYKRSVPIEVRVLFDRSGGMRMAGALDPHIFEENLLRERENVAISVYGFSNLLMNFCRPTRDLETLRKATVAVASIPAGNTLLFRAVEQAAGDSSAGGGKAIRILVVLSDGVSSAPNVTDIKADIGRYKQAIETALESGTAIFPVLLSGGAISSAASTAEPDSANPASPRMPSAQEVFANSESLQLAGDALENFGKLAPATGGETLRVAGPNALERAMKVIAAHIEHSYVVGFYPSSSGGDKRHKVQVVLTSKGRGKIVGGIRTVVHKQLPQ